MSAYYNEFDSSKAAWLRELIKAGAIAPGEVDQRSIKDVAADDVRGFTQCHFFAGVGAWSYALRLAGWPDDRPAWTGSCPCPSFSAAGKGLGFGDPRHLWPDWFRLVRESQPAIVFGEQVEAAIGHGWLDLVATDMESADYAFGSAVLPAAGVGAPHIRARVWFVAESQCPERRAQGQWRDVPRGREQTAAESRGNSATGIVGNSEWGRCEQRDASERRVQEPDAGCADDRLDNSTSARRDAARSGPEAEAWNQARLRGLESGCAAGELGDTSGARLSQRERNGRVQPGTIQPSTREATERGSYVERVGDTESSERRLSTKQWQGASECARASRPDYWRNPIWIPCRDGKWRPLPRAAESELVALPDGTAGDLGYMRLPSGETVIAPLIEKGRNRVMRLRGYGDAINVEGARAFIECCDPAHAGGMK